MNVQGTKGQGNVFVYYQIKSNQIKSSQIKSNQIKSNRIESNRIESNQIKSFQKYQKKHTYKMSIALDQKSCVAKHALSTDDS